MTLGSKKNTNNITKPPNNLNIKEMYKCKRCKKVFDRKSNYECHVNRIFKCSPSNSNKTAKKLTIPNVPIVAKFLPDHMESKNIWLFVKIINQIANRIMMNLAIITLISICF